MESNFRSKEFSEEDSPTDAQKFVLIAFVNDVDQSVVEGSDGIEHMYVKDKVCVLDLVQVKDGLLVILYF